MANNNPDLLYNRSRTDLLRYEDARFNSLIQAIADFYSTRNDQSVWGNFIRALAIDLARLDYDYGYDIVNKDPSLLTPPDIRRRWATPLYVSSNWPSSGQFDTQYKQMLVSLLDAYRMGTTIEAIQDVIEAYTGISIQVVELYKEMGNGIFDQSDRNSISVSVQVGDAGTNPLTTVTSLSQLQIIIQSLYNAIALAKPAHVGLDFTAIFGEGESLDCMISAQTLTQEQFVQLSLDQQSIYQFTGYTQINPALFWKASTPFPLGNLLRDLNGNFQIATSIGNFPNDTGLTVPMWSTVSRNSTSDNELTWNNISPAVISTQVTQGVLTVNLSFTVPINIGTKVTLINLGVSTFLNKVSLIVTNVTGSSFTANFVHTDYPATAEITGTATFALPANITTVQFSLLNLTWQSLYQNQYTNYCCGPSATNPRVVSCDSVPQGITDTLRIFVELIEPPPYSNPLLIQAPVLNPANPKTTIAAYGRILSPSLQPAAWAALPKIFVNIVNGVSDGVNATYTYVPTTQFLHEGEMVTTLGFSNPALNVTAPIKNVFNLVANINGTSITEDVLTVNAPNLFTAGMLVTLLGTAETFLNGQSIIITSTTPDSFTANFAAADYSNPNDSGTAEVSTFQISSSTKVTIETPSTITNAGLVTPTLQSAYYLSNGAYVLGYPPINLTGTGTGESWVPSGTVFQGQIVVDSNGNTQLALNNGTSGTNPPPNPLTPPPMFWNPDEQSITVDGSVRWRNVGRNTFNTPNNWVQILNMATDAPTGEVGNWDVNHQYGLLAPRLNSVWEISSDESFIFGLY